MGLIINSSLITPDMQDIEVVERKGLGHPDSLVDGIVEATEIDYCRYCLSQFGVIPHHNFDKAMLIGGMCLQKFGGEQYQHPVTFVFMGRASKSFGEMQIPLEQIQKEAAINYINRILPNFDTTDKSKFCFKSITSSNSTRPYWFAPRNVSDLPEYSDEPMANDTATMISYYPLTVCEQLALIIERFFYSDWEKLPHPKFAEYGQDIKVMIVRHHDNINATVSVPQITYHTLNLDIYRERERDLREKLPAYVKSYFPNHHIELVINPQSLTKKPRPYLVTSGSCIDFGEEGAVGRGNKTRGIISSFRPNTMEAPHGKNSTYFVGKVLGYLCDKISEKIYQKTGTPCQVVMQANIGDSLYDPSKIIVSTRYDVDKAVIEAIVASFLSKKGDTTLRILDSLHYIPRLSI